MAGVRRVGAAGKADDRAVEAAAVNRRPAGGRDADRELLLCGEGDERFVDAGAVLLEKGEVGGEAALHLDADVAAGLGHRREQCGSLGPIAPPHQRVGQRDGLGDLRVGCVRKGHPFELSDSRGRGIQLFAPGNVR